MSTELRPGAELGPSRWLEITQTRIDAFAEATDDRQAIHVDPNFAATGPFGQTVAHGLLTLSLIVPMWAEVAGPHDGTTLNYGLNRVRFPAPVPSGAGSARAFGSRASSRSRAGCRRRSQPWSSAKDTTSPSAWPSSCCGSSDEGGARDRCGGRDRRRGHARARDGRLVGARGRPGRRRPRDARRNRAVVDAAIEQFGRLDAVVANAGFQHVAPVEEFPEDRWDALLAVLLTSPFLLAKYAWPALAKSGDGRFCDRLSARACRLAFKAGYVAAKHGLLGLVKTLALEGAEAGICATAVCPGFVRTPLVEAQLAAQAAAHGMPAERVLDEVILAPQAVKRLLEPDEVADVVAFLRGPAGRPSPERR